MNFLEKLDFLMDKYDLNKSTLSQKSDIPYTTIDGWYKKGFEGLKLTTLRKLASFFNTSLDYWVLDEITDPNYGKTNGFQIMYEEMNYIQKYRSLDAYGQETVSIVLDREYSRVQSLQEALAAKDTRITELESTLNKRPAALYLYSYMNKIACAGTGFYFEDIPSDTIKAPYVEDADFIIGVSGDSMEPDYYDGDKLYVRKTDEIPTGKIGIFLNGNECFIKELGIDGLISHNKKYDNIPASEDIRVVGEVLGKVKES